MRLCFVLDARAAVLPEVRHILETLAILAGYPTRFATVTSEVGTDEALIFVGEPAAAPPNAAAVIPVSEWARWQPADLRLATFEGRPLPCPRGKLMPAASERELPAEWLRSTGFLLGREEEALDRRRDQWDCYAGNFSSSYELGILDRPLVNVAAAELARRVESWAARRGVAARAKPLERREDDARLAVVLSHDVDDIRYASVAQGLRLLGRARSPWSYALRGGISQVLRGFEHRGAADDPYWRFDQWAREEENRGYRSTYFVFPPRPARPHELDPLFSLDDAIRFEGKMQPFASVLRELARRGFEIGLHASYQSHRSAERLASERAQIERAAGVPIAGVRQHFLRFAMPRTWQAQEAAGFAYDSTLGYNEALGFRAGIAAPFRPWDPERRTASGLLELPLTVMDGALFRTLLLDSAQAARRVIEQLEIVEAVGGLAVLLWHPNGADEQHFPGWWSSYREVLSWLSGRSAWVATGSEIQAWWREREKAVLGG